MAEVAVSVFADLAAFERDIKRIPALMDSTLKQAAAKQSATIVNLFEKSTQAQVKSQKFAVKEIIGGWIEGSKSSINAIQAQDKAFSQSIQNALKNEALKQSQAQKFADLQSADIQKLQAQQEKIFIRSIQQAERLAATEAKQAAQMQVLLRKEEAQRASAAKRIDTLIQRSANVAAFAEKQNLDIVGRTVQKRDIEVDKIRNIIKELQRVGASESQIAKTQQLLAKTAGEWSAKVAEAQSGKPTVGGFEGFSNLQNQLQNLGGRLGQQAAGGLGLVETSLAALVTPAGAATLALAGTVAVVGGMAYTILNSVKHTALLTAELSRMAAKFGSTITEVGGLRAAVESLGGSETDVIQLFQDSGEKLFEFRQGTGEAKQGFIAMGVSAQDADKALRSNRDAFDLVLSRLSKMPDSALKTTAAMKIFGDDGANIALSLSRLGGSLDEITQKFSFFSGAPKENERALAQLGTVLGLLEKSLDGLTARIGERYGPAFLGLAKDVLAAMMTLQQNFPIIAENLEKTLARLASAARVYFGVMTVGFSELVLSFSKGAAKLAGMAGEKTLLSDVDFAADFEKNRLAVDALADSMTKMGNTLNSTTSLFLNDIKARQKWNAEVEKLTKGKGWADYQIRLKEIDAAVKDGALIEKNAILLRKQAHKEYRDSLDKTIRKTKQAANTKYASDPIMDMYDNIRDVGKEAAKWERQILVITKGEPWVRLQERIAEIETATGEVGLTEEAVQILRDDAQREYQEALEKTKKKIDEVGDAEKLAAERAKKLGDNISSVFDRVNKLFGSGGAGAIAGAFTGTLDLAGIGAGIGAAYAFGLPPEIGKQIGQAASQALQGGLSLVGFDINSFADAFNGLTKSQADAAIAKVRTDADAQIAALEEKLKTGEITQDAFDEQVASIEQAFAEASQQIQEKTASALITKAFQGIDEAIARLVENTPIIVQGLVDGFKKALELLPTVLPDLFQSLGDLSGQLIAILVDVVSSPEIYSALTEASIALVTGFAENAPQIAIGLIKAVWLALPAMTVGFYEGLYNAAVNAFESLKGIFYELGNVLVAPIEAVINFIIDTLNKMIGVVNLIPGVEIGQIAQIDITRHNGGMVEAAHNGRLAMDEAVTRLRRGEGVLSPQGVQNIGGPEGVQRANNGTQNIGQPTVVQMVYNNRVLHEVLYDQLGLRGPLRSATRNTSTPGFKNIYAKAG